MDTTSSLPRLAADAAQRCSAAADAAVECSRVCLADPRVYDLEECIEWCVLSSQVLGSCAQALARPFTGGRSRTVAAAAEAGLLAAEGCAAATRAEAAQVPGCADVAAACDDAADALRAFLGAGPDPGSGASEPDSGLTELRTTGLGATAS